MSGKKKSSAQERDKSRPKTQTNLDEAIASLQALTALSDFDTALFTPTKNEEGLDKVDMLFTTDGCQKSCPRCAHVGDGDYWSDECRKTHVAAGMLADRYGGKYVYVCPEKKLFIAAPVIRGRSVSDIMIAGPAEIEEDDEEQAPYQTPYEGYTPFHQCTVDNFHRVTLLLAAIATVAGENEESYLRRVGQVEDNTRSQMSDSLIRNSEKTIMHEYPIASENDMVEAIKAANPVSALASFDRIYGAFNSYGMMRGDHNAYERLADLVVIITRAGLDAGIDTGVIFTAGERCREDLKYTSTSLQVYHRIRYFIEEVVGYVQTFAGLGYDRNIYRIQTYIFTHYTEPLTLEKIAVDVGYSPAYLSRVFKEKTGENLFSFINKVRIDAAMIDLRSSNYTVAEVAERNGFESVGYFTRVFKKATGVTPGYFRDHSGQIKDQ